MKLLTAADIARMLLMADRQLLEAAARAAGHEVARWSDDGQAPLLVGVQQAWRPLEDDGDAFRLACDLCIDLDWSHGGEVQAYRSGDYYDGRVYCEQYESAATSKRTAARTAVVRCAAEIGEALASAQEGR